VRYYQAGLQLAVKVKGGTGNADWFCCRLRPQGLRMCVIDLWIEPNGAAGRDNAAAEQEEYEPMEFGLLAGKARAV